MPFAKSFVTLEGVNYLFAQFEIKIVELPTGGYRATREGDVIGESRILKVLAKDICALLPLHSDWLS